MADFRNNLSNFYQALRTIYPKKDSSNFTGDDYGRPIENLLTPDPDPSTVVPEGLTGIVPQSKSNLYQKLTPPPQEARTVGQDLYAAINQAEMTGQPDHWIRTKSAPAEGSTAFGPVQITKGLAKGYLKVAPELFDKEELGFLKKFIKQGEVFAKYGKEPNKSGYDAKYDYGGSGDLIKTEKDKELYERMATKMLTDIYNKNDGDLDKTWQEWRFGPQGGTDERYKRQFFNKIAKD